MKTSARLPFQFNSSILEKELHTAVNSWIKHFNTDYYAGDWSGVQLRGPEKENHEISPGHAGTKKFVDLPILKTLPYVQKVIKTIQAPIDSVRFLRLTPGSKIKPHKDYDLEFWDGFMRIHVPIKTNDKVTFILDDKKLDMKPGECWFGDFSKTHSVINEGETERVHLVIDCKVNDWVHKLFIEEGIIEKGEKKPDPIDNYSNESKLDMIKSLLEIDSEVSRKMADDLMKKYKLNL